MPAKRNVVMRIRCLHSELLKNYFKESKDFSTVSLEKFSVRVGVSQNIGIF